MKQIPFPRAFARWRAERLVLHGLFLHAPTLLKAVLQERAEANSVETAALAGPRCYERLIPPFVDSYLLEPKLPLRIGAPQAACPQCRHRIQAADELWDVTLFRVQPCPHSEVRKVGQYYCEPCQLHFLDNSALCKHRVFAVVSDDEDLSICPPRLLVSYVFAGDYIIGPFSRNHSLSLTAQSKAIAAGLLKSVLSKIPSRLTFSTRLVMRTIIAWTSQLDLRARCRCRGQQALKDCHWCRLSLHAGIPLCRECPIQLLSAPAADGADAEPQPDAQPDGAEPQPDGADAEDDDETLPSTPIQPELEPEIDDSEDSEADADPPVDVAPPQDHLRLVVDGTALTFKMKNFVLFARLTSKDLSSIFSQDGMLAAGPEASPQPLRITDRNLLDKADRARLETILLPPPAPAPQQNRERQLLDHQGDYFAQQQGRSPKHAGFLKTLQSCGRF